MEDEDIKRIECLIEKCKQCKLNACITCDICWSEVQAIENLLNRLKTAERMNDVLVQKIGIYDYDEKCFYNQDNKKCIGNKEKSCSDCIKEWARKKVEDEL